MILAPTLLSSRHTPLGAASTSAAAMLGISTNEILEATDWSNESTFQRFYYKPTDSSVFGKAVLSATNNTIDMRD